MSGSVIETGDKLHVITRRTFETDPRRPFVGEVAGVQGDLHELGPRA